MFELFHHAMHMKAHFTQLMPEEDRQDYIQPHNPGICTQFRVCTAHLFVFWLTSCNLKRSPHASQLVAGSVALTVLIYDPGSTARPTPSTQTSCRPTTMPAGTPPTSLAGSAWLTMTPAAALVSTLSTRPAKTTAALGPGLPARRLSGKGPAC